MRRKEKILILFSVPLILSSLRYIGPMACIISIAIIINCTTRGVTDYHSIMTTIGMIYTPGGLSYDHKSI
jgi:hypothetical protein